MKKEIDLWAFCGFAVTSFGGTILHFLYDLLDKSVCIAPFSGVNESTWEHMKLLFWPMLLFAVAQRFSFRDQKDFWCVKLRAIAVGLVLIPTIFYTYNGAIGKSPDWLNIVIFFIAAAIAYVYEARLFHAKRLQCAMPNVAVTLLLILAMLFVVFTFAPPQIEIFKDPLTGGFGI